MASMNFSSSSIPKQTRVDQPQPTNKIEQEPPKNLNWSLKSWPHPDPKLADATEEPLFDMQPPTPKPKPAEPMPPAKARPNLSPTERFRRRT